MALLSPPLSPSLSPRRPLAALLLAALGFGAAPASAQPMEEVPLGARAVSVLLCDEPGGCPAARSAIAAASAEGGAPLLDFDTVAAAGPAGAAASARYAAALEGLEGLDRAPAIGALFEAREALRALPFTTDDEEPARILLLLADRRRAAGDLVGADADLRAAAASTGGRATDLPPLSPATLSRYLELAAEGGTPAVVELGADVEDARLFVDGHRVEAGPIELRPGWHRLSAERPGRRTAWTAELQAPAGARLSVTAELHGDDGAAALEAAVLGALRGQEPPAAVAETLADWGAANGLRWVRFVHLRPLPSAAEATPGERLEAPDGSAWALSPLWLDVERRRFVHPGPGVAILSEAPGPQRFRLGAGLGYLYLEPRHHVVFEVQALYRLRPPLSVELRLGAMRTGQPYYLYPGWVDTHVYPASLGLRAGSAEGGPWAGLALLAVVPYATGGLGRAGWDFAPTPWWRIGLEAQGGWSDHGPLLGGSLHLARRS